MTTLDENTGIRQNPRIAARTLDGKTVIVVLDARKVHALNELGSTIWNMADGRSLKSIVEAVTAEYEVQSEIARADVSLFVEQLVSLNMLELVIP
ncbi:MAG: PqqD family protein [Myxococcales bacterium]|nr:PqqD family protein [Myxococcales bacterium]MCB9707540.1 PqqD family protein [Myxococcales bacterium]